jgi:hypothetical protein
MVQFLGTQQLAAAITPGAEVAEEVLQALWQMGMAM